MPPVCVLLFLPTVAAMVEQRPENVPYGPSPWTALLTASTGVCRTARSSTAFWEIPVPEVSQTQKPHHLWDQNQWQISRKVLGVKHLINSWRIRCMIRILWRCIIKWRARFPWRRTGISQQRGAVSIGCCSRSSSGSKSRSSQALSRGAKRSTRHELPRRTRHSSSSWGHRSACCPRDLQTGRRQTVNRIAHTDWHGRVDIYSGPCDLRLLLFKTSLYFKTLYFTTGHHWHLSYISNISIPPF